MKPKIFVFCRLCQLDPPFGKLHFGVALSEDGIFLGIHPSSDHAWVYHDMGADKSGWKHDTYALHYPDGFEVEYVEGVYAHDGVLAAFAKYEEMSVDEYEAKIAPLKDELIKQGQQVEHAYRTLPVGPRLDSLTTR